MIRVVIADDQPVVRMGFAAMINAEPDLEVVGLAANGHEAIAQVRQTKPDVVVMDIRMPLLDGIAATQAVKSLTPAPHVLILTTFDLDEYVWEALAAGAHGFLLKDVSQERLVEGVRAVADGSMLLSPHAAREVARSVPSARSFTDFRSRLDNLTIREHDVLRGVADGLSNAEIAHRLFLTEATVKSYLSEVYRKTGQRDRVQLAIAAHEARIFL